MSSRRISQRHSDTFADAHLINQDFFGDLLEVLKTLIIDPDLPLMSDAEGGESINKVSELPTRTEGRFNLLCVTTAFALLEGQDIAKSASSLGLDLSFFTKLLYNSLPTLAVDTDIELSARTARQLHAALSGAAFVDTDQALQQTSKINVQTTIVLLVRAISAALIPRSSPPLRLAAFTKQLYAAALQLPEKSSRALLGVLTQTLKNHSRKLATMWNTEERRCDGVYDPSRSDFEGSNPFASTVWEGELLRHHFCPKVKEAAKELENIAGSVA